MQHLDHGRLLLQPARQLARGAVLCVVAQRDAGQGAQHGLGVVAAHAQAQAHMGQLDAHVQRLVARDDAAHEHIAAAAGVLGERMDGGVHAQAVRAVAQQVEGIEGQARTPGVVQHGGDAACAAQAHHGDEVRELHGHRARRLQPDQPRLGRDFGFEVGNIHGVVALVAHAEMGQLALAQGLVGTVGVVGQQHLVAGAQQGQGGGGDGRQAAGHQQALQAAFQRAQALFQQEGGGRAVQAVGVAALVQPLAAAHGRHVLEDHRRGLVHGRLRRNKALGRLVGMVDEMGADLQVGCAHAAHLMRWAAAFRHKKTRRGIRLVFTRATEPVAAISWP